MMDYKTLQDYGLAEATLIEFTVPVYHLPSSTGIYRPKQVLQAKDVTLHALSFENCWRVVKEKNTSEKEDELSKKTTRLKRKTRRKEEELDTSEAD